MEHGLCEAAIKGSTGLLHALIEQDELILDKIVVGCFNKSPLHVAAACGHTQFVKELLQRKSELAEFLDSRHQSALHLASAKGYVEIVKELIKASPDMCLARDRDGKNPLHIAVFNGKTEVFEELIRANPNSAKVLYSDYRLPLHLKSVEGHVEIMKALIPDMCLSCDRDGRNPLHIAAMKGKVKELEALIRASPHAARVLMDGGETILHLCVKHHRLDTLQLLIREMGQEFVNAKDDGGNTILHLAVLDKQLETIEYLLSSTRVDVNSMNANGFSALDILAQNRRDEEDSVIEESLRRAGALQPQDTQITTTGNGNTRPRGMSFNVPHDQITPLPMPGNNSQVPLATAHDQTAPLPMDEGNLLKLIRGGGIPQINLTQADLQIKDRDALMVVASLIATMAFQAGLNPPGGVWQDNLTVDSHGNPVPNPHRAGEAIIAYTYSSLYKYYLRFNTIGFVASLSVISLLISRLPYNHRIMMQLLLVILWLSITAMAFTYAFSTVVVTPKKNREQLSHTMYVAVPVWCFVMTIVLLAHTIYVILPSWMTRLWPFRGSSNSVATIPVHGNRGAQVQLTTTHSSA